MFTHRPARRTLWVATLVGMSTFGLGFTQPEGDQFTERQPEADRLAPEQIRRRLDAHLEWARGFVKRLEAGISQIDQGKEVEPALWREIGRFGPEGMRGRPGELPIEGREPPRNFRDGDLAEREPLPVAEMRAFIDEQLPWLSERLARADEKFPGSSERMIRGFERRIAELMQQHEEDPIAAGLFIDQFRLGADIVDEARRVRQGLASGEMTEAEARSVWRTLAERHVDIRERLTRHEIEQARARLEELESRLATDTEQRAQMIEDMAERMFRRSMRGDRHDDRKPDAGPREGRPDGERRKSGG